MIEAMRLGTAKSSESRRGAPFFSGMSMTHGRSLVYHLAGMPSPTIKPMAWTNAAGRQKGRLRDGQPEWLTAAAVCHQLGQVATAGGYEQITADVSKGADAQVQDERQGAYPMAPPEIDRQEDSPQRRGDDQGGGARPRVRQVRFR